MNRKAFFGCREWHDMCLTKFNSCCERRDRMRKTLKPNLKIAALWFLALALFPASAGAGAAAAEAAVAADPSLVLAAEAVRSNPGLAALSSRIEGLRRRADASRVWKDPVVSLEYGNVPYDSFSLGDSPMSGVQMKLSQTVPWPGKNRRREAAAVAEADAKEWELAEARLQLSDMVRRTYWRLALTRQLEALTREHVELTDQLVTAVRAKYEAGRAGQHDLLSLEVLKDKLTDDLDDFGREERSLTAAINAALHREVTTPVETPSFTPAGGADGDLSGLVEEAKAVRPLLKLWKARAEMFRLSAERTGYEVNPDVTFWAGWRARERVGSTSGVDFLSFGLAVPLPFDYTDRWESGAAAFLADAKAAERRYDADLDEIGSRIEEALAAWDRAAGKVAAYDGGLIPLAKKTVESTLSAYQTDRADFASLYQAEVQLIDLERAERRARYEAVASRIRAATLTGRSGLE